MRERERDDLVLLSDFEGFAFFPKYFCNWLLLLWMCCFLADGSTCVLSGVGLICLGDAGDDNLAGLSIAILWLCFCGNYFAVLTVSCESVCRQK